MTNAVRCRNRHGRFTADRRREQPLTLRSKDAFAHLCGVAPIPTPLRQGRPPPLRNCRGNRDANRALYTNARGRMCRDRRTRDYVARRTAEGKSKKERPSAASSVTSLADSTVSSSFHHPVHVRRVQCLDVHRTTLETLATTILRIAYRLGRILKYEVTTVLTRPHFDETWSNAKR